ncbi:MAG: transaldolase [Gammaproteobacteria bacterium]|nr:transaldolase [Gammaproteobacteria bacterium]
MNPLLDAKALGQSFWLDNLSRTLLQEGALKKLIEQDGVSGVTSNPSIFHKAISSGAYYQPDLLKLKSRRLGVEQIYEQLVIPDIQAACDLLQPVYAATKADDGYVSLEVAPHLAHEEQATIDAAMRLHAQVDRRNLLIKVPATPAGARAVEKLIGAGISVNITLMFSLHHVMEIAQAYTHGLRHWIANGGDPRPIKSVASLFLSRVDTLIDKQLEKIATPEALALRGHAAVAMAKLAYQRYKDIFHGSSFEDLRKQGARPQYLLWASTGAKNPNYSDLLYVEPLIGRETINTLPDATLAAFRDHGRAALTLEQDVKQAQDHILALEKCGIDMRAAGESLQDEGVKLFAESYAKLMNLLS